MRIGLLILSFILLCPVIAAPATGRIAPYPDRRGIRADLRRYGLEAGVCSAPFRRRFAADRADCRGLRAAALAALAASAAFVFVLSLSRAPDFGWHLSTALPRLLWVPSLLLLAEIVAFPSRAEPQRVRGDGE